MAAREPQMVQVRNAHTAPVAKVAPGQTGTVDANNPGVQVALRAGLLHVVRDDGFSAPLEEGSVPASEHRRAVAEIDALRREIDALRHENAALRAELEEATRPTPSAPAAPAEPEEAPKPSKPAKAVREG